MTSELHCDTHKQKKPKQPDFTEAFQNLNFSIESTCVSKKIGKKHKLCTQVENGFLWFLC